MIILLEGLINIAQINLICADDADKRFNIQCQRVFVKVHANLGLGLLESIYEEALKRV